MDRIDHVVLLLDDLDEASRTLFARTGLRAVPGHVMPGHWLRSAVIPLGEDYLELLAMIDRERAQATVEGRWYIEAVRAGLRIAGWCVRTTELDARAARVGAPIVTGFHSLGDGPEVVWRSMGIDVMMRDPCLPFFIEWTHEERLPGLAEPDHQVRPSGISSIEIRGDRERIARWLGDHQLPVRVVEGEPPMVERVCIATDAGEIELDQGSLGA